MYGLFIYRYLFIYFIYNKSQSENHMADHPTRHNNTSNQQKAKLARLNKTNNKN